MKNLILLIAGTTLFFSALWFGSYTMSQVQPGDWWAFPSLMTFIFAGFAGIGMTIAGGTSLLVDESYPRI